MNSDELIGVLALAFFLSFILGWVLRWGYSGFNKINASDMGEIDDLTNRLYEMEHAKDAAESQLKEREWELTNKISQLEAELSAAMEGLGAARREAEKKLSHHRANDFSSSGLASTQVLPVSLCSFFQNGARDFKKSII